MKTKNIIKKVFLCSIFIFIGIITTHPDTVSGSGGGGSVHTHSWQAATCIRPATCSTCGATSGSALGHDIQTTYYPWNGRFKHEKYMTCSRYGQGGCTYFQHPVYDCSFGGWTTTSYPSCTSEGSRYRSCVYCGQTQTEAIPALGHDWTWWSYNASGHWYTCRRCSATTNYGNHWDSNCNGYCNTCGYQMFILVNKPVLNVTSFIYNGLSQSPTFRSFDTAHVNISGNSEIDAGTYTATISLKNTAIYKTTCK